MRSELEKEEEASSADSEGFLLGLKVERSLSGHNLLVRPLRTCMSGHTFRDMPDSGHGFLDMFS